MIEEFKMSSKIILASTSNYRKELLQRICRSFTTSKPNVNEEKLKFDLLADLKNPIEIAAELALAKALSIKTEDHNTTIIAGDQLVSFNRQILGKPGSKEQAIKQLQQMSDQTHELITSVVVIHQNNQSKIIKKINHISKLKFKKLSDPEIIRYVDLDKPFDCSGSYKIEAHGIGLFSEIQTDDFTAIQGLPLIWLSHQLKEFGHDLFS